MFYECFTFYFTYTFLTDANRLSYNAGVPLAFFYLSFVSQKFHKIYFTHSLPV